MSTKVHIVMFRFCLSIRPCNCGGGDRHQRNDRKTRVNDLLHGKLTRLTFSASNEVSRGRSHVVALLRVSTRLAVNEVSDDSSSVEFQPNQDGRGKRNMEFPNKDKFKLFWWRG